MSTQPNSTLRAVRMSMQMSQDDLARALREAGVLAASKRMVQRWESGSVSTPHPRTARALEQVTGLPVAQLGFSIANLKVQGDGHGGHDVEAENSEVTGMPVGLPGTFAQSRADFSGVWLSRYQYYSSGRSATFTGLHYVLVLQHGNRLTVRSIPGSSNNPLSMDLTVDGNVVTGTWVEQTAAESYYKGARYHGAIQMLVDPSGRRMTGKWVGFGSEMDVNTGPWELVFQDAGTDQRTVAQYDKRPESE